MQHTQSDPIANHEYDDGVDRKKGKQWKSKLKGTKNN